MVYLCFEAILESFAPAAYSDVWYLEQASRVFHFNVLHNHV